MILPTKFRDNWFFGSGEEAQNRFSRWQLQGIIDFQDGNQGSHLGLQIRMTVANFDLLSQYLQPSFESNGLSVQEKCKIDFQVGGQGSHLGWTILAILIYKLPRYFLPSFESIGLLVQEKKCKIDFQDGGHLRFLIQTI